MIQIIAGEKGKGKTKILLDKVNADVASAKGSIVYLDKSNKHMYELNNKVRLINVRDYLVEEPKEFLGFVCGLISQDHDLEKIYIDSFLKIACTDANDIPIVMEKLELITDKFQVDIVISMSMNGDALPEIAKKYVSVSL
ncbi:MAG: twitching motility protein PilT [Lachnospiraceae bacterium]|nr:twitching motility protein PilT [Lachnospiraceae bacterium]